MSESWWAQYVAPAALTVGILLGIGLGVIAVLCISVANGWSM